MKSQLLIFVLIICFSLNVLAQPIETREKTIFNKGVEFYKNGDFKEAENSFNLVINRLPDSRYITAYYLMLAKSQYKLKKYSGAINLTKTFIDYMYVKGPELLPDNIKSLIGRLNKK